MAQRSQFSPGGLFRERSSTNYAERVIRIRFTIELLNLFFLTDFVFACFTTFAFECFPLLDSIFFLWHLVVALGTGLKRWIAPFRDENWFKCTPEVDGCSDETIDVNETTLSTCSNSTFFLTFVGFQKKICSVPHPTED